MGSSDEWAGLCAGEHCAARMVLRTALRSPSPVVSRQRRTKPWEPHGGNFALCPPSLCPEELQQGVLRTYRMAGGEPAAPSVLRCPATLGHPWLAPAHTLPYKRRGLPLPWPPAASLCRRPPKPQFLRATAVSGGLYGGENSPAPQTGSNVLSGAYPQKSVSSATSAV